MLNITLTSSCRKSNLTELPPEGINKERSEIILSVICADSLILPVYCTLTKILYLILRRTFRHFAACAVMTNLVSVQKIKTELFLKKKQRLETVNLSFLCNTSFPLNQVVVMFTYLIYNNLIIHKEYQRDRSSDRGYYMAARALPSRLENFSWKFLF